MVTHAPKAVSVTTGRIKLKSTVKLVGRDRGKNGRSKSTLLFLYRVLTRDTQLVKKNA
jgi:hypothetical protein